MLQVDHAYGRPLLKIIGDNDERIFIPYGRYAEGPYSGGLSFAFQQPLASTYQPVAGLDDDPLSGKLGPPRGDETATGCGAFVVLETTVGNDAYMVCGGVLWKNRRSTTPIGFEAYQHHSYFYDQRFYFLALQGPASPTTHVYDTRTGRWSTSTFKSAANQFWHSTWVEADGRVLARYEFGNTPQLIVDLDDLSLTPSDAKPW
jgi:hypothetical protein